MKLLWPLSLAFLISTSYCAPPNIPSLVLGSAWQVTLTKLLSSMQGPAPAELPSPLREDWGLSLLLGWVPSASPGVLGQLLEQLRTLMIDLSFLSSAQASTLESPAAGCGRSGSLPSPSLRLQALGQHWTRRLWSCHSPARFQSQQHKLLPNP